MFVCISSLPKVIKLYLEKLRDSYIFSKARKKEFIKSSIITSYFLKIKYTARIKKQKPIMWLVVIFELNTITENAEKITRVMTSCITFSCTKLKGPPFPSNPILFAGT